MGVPGVRRAGRKTLDATSNAATHVRMPRRLFRETASGGEDDPANGRFRSESAVPARTADPLQIRVVNNPRQFVVV